VGGGGGGGKGGGGGGGGGYKFCQKQESVILRHRFFL